MNLAEPEVIVREIRAVELDLGEYGIQLARVEDSGCWRWLRYVDPSGYGRVGRNQAAHRKTYEALIGPIPPGLVLDHLCRNRACVNPAHLEPVTERDNILRGESPSARLYRQTHCKRGHPFDPGNTYRAPDGSRVCRMCQRETVRRYKSRARAAA